MKRDCIKKSKKMKRIIFIFFVTLLVFSCRKDKDLTNETMKEYPVERYVNTSLKGVVINDRDKVIEGAIVKIGNNVLKTDFNGTFYFENINAKLSGTLIEVSKTGYIEQKKIFYPELNATSYIRIKMEENGQLIYIQPTDKDKIFGDKTHIVRILGDGFEKNGKYYTEKLLVEWQGINENELEHNQIAAPVGYNKDFELKGLNSFGIIKINIFDENKQKVELTKTNTIQLELGLLNLEKNYPEKVALWYFNDSKAMWLEKGEAILTKENGRNFYLAEVEKTGYWNFASSIEVEKKTFTIQSNEDTLKFANSIVKSKDSNYSVNLRVNENGNISCYVPKDEDLILSVTLEDKSIEQELDITKTIINVDIDYYTKTIVGSFVNCNGEKIENGYITIFVGKDRLFYYLSSDGAFKETIVIEKDLESISWYATDLNEAINTGVHTTEIAENGEFNMTEFLLCKEPYAILSYGNDFHKLDLIDSDKTQLYFEFEDESYNLNESFLSFHGVGEYPIIKMDIQIKGKPGEYIFINDLNSKMKITEYNNPGMMMGHYDGMARRSVDGINIDTAFLQIDFSVFIE